MTRKRSISAAILGIAIGLVPLSAAAAPCATSAPADVIRQRFVDRGAAVAIVGDPREVAAVTGALLVSDASPALVGDQYLAVVIAGMILVYRVEGDLVCTDAVAPIKGQLAADLIKRLTDIYKSN